MDSQIPQPDIDIHSLREKFFPFSVAGKITFRAVPESEMRVFVNEKISEVFPEEPKNIRFSPSAERQAAMKPMVQRYRKLHHEFFLFFNERNDPIGWHMGEADDAFTFYMRNTGILPEFRNRGIYRAFCERLTSYLAAIGYERISSHHKGTNRPILITKLKMGFSISGIDFNESWGPLVKMVKLLPADRREAFYRQFGSTNHLKYLAD